jgi:hypothetical protein
MYSVNYNNVGISEVIADNVQDSLVHQVMTFQRSIDKHVEGFAVDQKIEIGTTKFKIKNCPERKLPYVFVSLTGSINSDEQPFDNLLLGLRIRVTDVHETELWTKSLLLGKSILCEGMNFVEFATTKRILRIEPYCLVEVTPLIKNTGEEMDYTFHAQFTGQLIIDENFRNACISPLQHDENIADATNKVDKDFDAECLEIQSKRNQKQGIKT